MRIGVALAQVPFLPDTGQTQGEELVQALRRAGHEAEIIAIPFNGRPEYRLVEQMLAYQLLDLEESMGTRIDRLIGLTFPAYLVPHSAKVIWLLQRCRPAYDLWETPYAALHATANGEHLRSLVRDADVRLIPQAQAVFVPSCTAAKQLRADCNVGATPLQAPPSYAERYHNAGDGDFFLLPALVGHPWREDLVLQAMRRTHHPVRLRVLSGFSNLAADSLSARISHGDAIGEERRALFSACLAVVFSPFNELDGLVALEAMLSEKAVITCNDTGGVAELVHDGRTGFICSPNPEALADLLDQLWEDRALARRLGRAARANYQELRLSWDKVVEQLLGSVSS